MPFPSIRPPLRLRRYLSSRLVRAAHDPDRSETMAFAELVSSLGERSFGWSLLVFALVNMLPLPFGTDMITAIPVLVVTSQIARGYHELHLPGFVGRRRVSRKGFQKLVLRLGPVLRPIDRMLKPRLTWLFAPRAERLFGCFLFLVGLALFAPIPLSGYMPAFAIALAGIALIERDGLVALAAGALGLAAIGVTVGLALMFLHGADALIR